MSNNHSIEITQRFFELLLSNYPHDPTEEQKCALELLSKYLCLKDKNSIFLLRGYAGTGKTSAIAALVKTLSEYNWSVSLLAPTGRAAKVMTNYSGLQASTIHRKLYFKTSRGGSNYFALMQNLHKNTVFIVDEASMISIQRGVKNPFERERSLLEDLIHYVKEGVGCQLILVGDTAQLPPVLEDESFALQREFITDSFGLTVFEYELKEVVRQAKSSGILYNSFQIRNQQNLNIDNKTESLNYPKLYSSEFDDVVRINGRELQDELENMNGRFGIQGCMVVTRSNKRANNFNQQIRSRILWHEDEICTGDLLMVVKNNYFWLGADSEAGFIANGDSIEILNIRGYEELYGKRFANVICRMIDYPNQPDLELKILLDTLMIDGPNLPAKEMKRFFEAVEEDYMEFSNRKQRIKKVLENPYFNALQVKFAYAVTCHKAQGGQWPAVFIDQGYLTDTMMNNEYLRWLYTAITRAQKIVYLVNFIDKFFPEEQSETF